MPNDTMFAPLAADELVDDAAATVQEEKTPIVPVPADAPPQSFRHPRYGFPTRKYEYRLDTGELAGYAMRFDFRRPNGTPDKEFLPVTFCDLGNGRRGWRSKGIPAPRPLYNLPEIVARPDAPVLVCEGEKAADAAKRLFPDYVATASMHGAKSPNKTDWSPLAGRGVNIWPDRDEPGIEFAQKAAALARQAGAHLVAIVAVPEDWPEGWDLADTLPEGVSLDTIRDLAASAPSWRAKKAAEKAGRNYISFGPYRMTKAGLWFDKVEDDDDEPPTWLSSPFEVLAQTRDPRSAQWGLLLCWRDPDSHVHEWSMPKEALGGSRDEIWRALLREGMDIASATSSRNLLADYLSRVKPKGRACGVSRIGWHAIGEGMTFVLPDRAYGDTAGERVIWQTEARADTFFKTAGTADEWKTEVAARCVGNSRLVFGVSAAFAGALLGIADEESGGFHLVGPSRAGKTTVLRVAGSVWGGGGSLGFARTWRATSNGLEGIAEAHNDAFLCLDEMGQVDAREAGEIAYMLANGAGKGRAGRDGSPRRSSQWRLIFLSTGELSLGDKMAEIGKTPKAGQEVRLADVPADADAGHGIFEDLHGAASPGAFAESLRSAANHQYGTAIRLFLEKLTDSQGADPSGLHDLIGASRDAFMAQHLPASASGQVRSVCGRFALVAAGGCLATAFGLTGWPDDEADRAAATCFKAWLDRRGGAGDGEAENGVRQVIAFIEAHGSSRFEAAWSDNVERIVNRVGFRQQVAEEWRYYILPEMWRREVAKGRDPTALLKVMIKRRLIIPAKDGKPSQVIDVRGHKKMRLYVLAAGIVSGEPSEGDNAG